MRRIRPLLARLARCHPVTWLVTLVVLTAVTLIVVPGEVRYLPYNQQLSWWEQQCKEVQLETSKLIDLERNGKWITPTTALYEHGWPRPYLARTKIIEAFQPYKDSKPKLTSGKMNSGFLGPSTLADFVSWSNYDNWPFESEAWRIHPGHLLLDSIIVVFVVGGTGLTTEWWLRSRGGLFRFRIIDLLALATICGLLLGWYKYHERITRLETQVAATHKKPRKKCYVNQYKSYDGPDWLRRLVGDDAYLPFLYHARDAGLTFDEGWEANFAELVKLPRLQNVRLTGSFPKSAVLQLKQCRRLKTMRLDFSLTIPAKRYEALPADAEIVDRQNLAVLGELDLQELTIDAYLVLAEDVEKLLAATKLYRLTLRKPMLTLDELATLRQRYPETKIAVRWSSWGSIDPLKDPAGHNAAVEAAKQQRALETIVGE